jgi:hypothetical protein
MKLQASDASALEGLQSQNLSRPENRLSVNGLAIVHGRLVGLRLQRRGFAEALRPAKDRFRLDATIREPAYWMG